MNEKHKGKVKIENEKVSMDFETKKFHGTFVSEKRNEYALIWKPYKQIFSLIKLESSFEKIKVDENDKIVTKPIEEKINVEKKPIQKDSFQQIKFDPKNDDSVQENINSITKMSPTGPVPLFATNFVPNLSSSDDESESDHENSESD